MIEYLNSHYPALLESVRARIDSLIIAISSIYSNINDTTCGHFSLLYRIGLVYQSNNYISLYLTVNTRE